MILEGSKLLPTLISDFVYEGAVLTLDGVKNMRVSCKDGFIKDVTELPEPINLKRMLMPGLVDLHVHYRDLEQASKETVESGSYHSMMTGVMLAGIMPNTTPPLDNLERLLAYKELCKYSHIDTRVRALLTPFSTKEELARMAEACNKWYKAFMGESVGSGFFNDNESLKQKINELPKESSLWLHCEDGKFLEKYKSKWNPLIPESHYDARPPKVETEAIKYVINNILSVNPDKKFIVCHVSTKEGIDLIREAKKKYNNLKAETCYQYLYFTKDDFKRNGYKLKCNPSIKTTEDREALFQAVLDKTIDYLASDHAPHTREDKIKYMSGMPSYDAGAFGWLINEVIKRYNGDEQKQYLANLLRTGSLNFKPEWEIKPGNHTRMIMLNMKQRWVREADNYTKATSVSPWVGEELPRLELIIHGDQAIYNKL